jgi:hypothetical protein
MEAHMQLVTLDPNQLDIVCGGFNWNQMIDNGNRWGQAGAVAGGGVGLVAGGIIGGTLGTAGTPLGTAAGAAVGAATGGGIGAILGGAAGFVGGAAYDAIKQTGYKPKFHTAPK